jgi:hypothetical protein
VDQGVSRFSSGPDEALDTLDDDEQHESLRAIHWTDAINHRPSATHATAVAKYLQKIAF